MRVLFHSNQPLWHSYTASHSESVDALSGSSLPSEDLLTLCGAAAGDRDSAAGRETNMVAHGYR